MLRRSRIRVYTFAPAHTTYPIYPDEIVNLSIDSGFRQRGSYPEMLYGQCEIILSTTAIILYPISELIKMNMSLHMIQI